MCVSSPIRTREALTEVLEGLLDLLSGEVEAGVRWDERRVQPVVVVVAVDGVRPQPVVRQLLLQQTDDLNLWEIRAVTHVCGGRKTGWGGRGLCQDHGRESD